MAKLGKVGAAALGVLSLVPSTALRSKDVAPAPYRLEMHVKIPMRDGTRLNATVYRPAADPTPLPVIMMLTPYPEFDGHPSGAYFAAHGYVYVVVDVRGRGESEGSFDPALDDAHDGFDAVEWLARQPWSDGKVGMFGGSYAGQDQWRTAALHPPHLVTIVPAASARFGTDFPLTHGIFGSYDMQWASFTSGRILNSQIFGDEALWKGVDRRLFLDKAPFSRLDAYAGNTSTHFQDWLRHPSLDDYWTARRGTKPSIASIDIPVLEITGQHDDDETGELSFHVDHESGGERAMANDYMVIGTWDHDGTRDPKRDVGTDTYVSNNLPEHYPPQSVIDILRLHREWYDYAMKGGPLPGFLQGRVNYYVAGGDAECWKAAGSVEDVAKGSLTFYLDASGGAHDVYRSGRLLPTASDARGGRWISDPDDPSAADGVDLQRTARLHGDGLIFHSAPFQKDVELSGRSDLRTWLEMDVPDTDVMATLYVVNADGRAHLIDQNFIRGRYRRSLDREEAVPEGRPAEFRFTNGKLFAVRARKGDSLRLILQSINDPALEKNWNSMKPVETQTSADAHVAHIRLLQDATHRSAITLPLGDPAGPCRRSATWTTTSDGRTRLPKGPNGGTTG